jgi:mono/diheme cytochrome c family protein
MRWPLLAIVPLVLSLGCEWDYERMIDQHKAKAYQANPYLPNEVTLQAPPIGTVSREQLLGPPSLAVGIVAGRYVDDVPIEVSRQTLERGRNRFEIFCAACHGLLGDGQSEVAENMTLVPPPSLHLARLRAFPAGRLFAVASQGYGLMPGYESRIERFDRWALVAYVQVLQLSQHIERTELPAQMTEEARPWLK